MGQRKSTSSNLRIRSARIRGSGRGVCSGRSGQRRRGVAAVEMAIILPLFVTIVLGCVDFGRFAYAYIGIKNAARAGAGYATFTPRPGSDVTRAIWVDKVQLAIKDELGIDDSGVDNLGLFDSAKLTILTPSVDSSSGSDVYSLALTQDTPSKLWRARVSVSYAWSPIVNWPGIPSALTLGHEVEMRFIR